MKSLRFILISMFVLIGTSFSGYSQSMESNLTEEQKEEMRAVAEEYISTLNLSDEQKEEFQAINLKYGQMMLELKESGGPKVAKIKKAKSIKADKSAEMKELLDEQQFVTYEAFQEEMSAKMKEIIGG